MKKALSFIAVLLASIGLRAQIAPAFTNHFQHIVDSVCLKNNIKGVSVAIMIPGDGIWTGVYGESYAGEPIRPGMYFPIGSNTKTFTSSTILKLQENGMLSLDDTIGTWLQNIPNVSGQITVRQLLNHTSGLYSYTDTSAFFTALNSDYNHIYQPEDMLQYISTPRSAPGAKWEYCNTNYLLAGLIIKHIQNQPYDASVRSMVLTPQGFNNTATYPAETPADSIPHGWTLNSSSQITDMQVDYGWSNNAFLSMASAAGAIMSTAEDNVKFWHALMTEQIVNNNSLAQMRSFIPITGFARYNMYGLGLFRGVVNGRVFHAHGGTCFGYLNENLVDSVSGICITVLTNQDYVGNDAIFNRIVKPLHKYILTLPPAGITAVNNDPAISLYPNPATDMLQVKLDNIHGSARLEIYDVTGRMQMVKEIGNGTNAVAIGTLQAGTYIARIINNGASIHTQRLQIIK
jgi:D-alanyl-D-alanine carboxypeptidase